MSGTGGNGSGKGGPALAQDVYEVQGHFPNDAALQDALSRLNAAGYDRAQLSLPDEQGTGTGTPTEGAENPTDTVDKAQLRTMGTSMAAYAGAVVAGGATLATGGLAGVAIAAAAAVGIGTGLTANAAGNAADAADVDRHDEMGAAGTLVLAVRTTTQQEVEQATALMTQSGATDVQRVSRGSDTLTAGVSSASWTG